jgi:hypothetical protein
MDHKITSHSIEADEYNVRSPGRTFRGLFVPFTVGSKTPSTPLTAEDLTRLHTVPLNLHTNRVGGQILIAGTGVLLASSTSHP